MRQWLLAVSGLVVAVSLIGCSAAFMNYNDAATSSSSLVNFLYPDEKSREVHEPSIPTLSLPLRVGVAFVPAQRHHREIPHAQQIALLEQVKAEFAQYEYIERIEVIPSTYLAGGQGFTTLDQVARLYNVDVMALVSHDQVVNTFDRKSSLLYWTIAGAYVVKGTENEVQTFVDTAVFDVRTRSMLFRAPGVATTANRTTLVEASAELSAQRSEGFSLAVEQMNENLKFELARFEDRVKNERIARVERRSGYSGGSFGTSLWAAWLVLFAAFAVRQWRLCRQA